MKPVFVFALILFLFLQTIRADLNITIDNTSAAIQYQGPWQLATFPGYDFGGSQALIDLGNNASPGVATATASFTFTGVFPSASPIKSHLMPS
jgi:hypothetical protein